MSTVAAIITLLASIMGLIAWWVKRKRAPTKAERIDDLKHEYQDTLSGIRRLRELGRDDEAESMLARIRSRAVAGWVQFKPSESGVSPKPDGERLGGDDSKGKQDHIG